MGSNGILFLVVCYAIFLTFFYRKVEFSCILVDKDGCFFTFFLKKIEGVWK